jgi:nitrite reductase/ring-hydroxylating ferredoxin subunit
MSSNESTSRESADACTACAPLHARREFLRTLVASVTGALLTLGASPAAAQRLATQFGGPLEHRGDEASYPVPDADGATIDTDNEVILVRYHNVAYAFALSCPHQNTGLKWNGDEGRFQCPKHKSKYQPDGTFIEGRATRGMDRHALRRDGAKVVVDLGTTFEQDKDAAGWAAAQIALA